MKRTMATTKDTPAMNKATNGGNGGYSRRKPMVDGLDKPMKLNYSGKFAATGVTKKK